MIPKLLRFLARRSHNVKVQVFLALFHGLISCFGIPGTILILVKLRKLAPKTKRRGSNDAMQRNGNVR